MASSVPNAKSARSSTERNGLARLAVARGLCGLANDTKWDELLSAMRSLTEWKPSFRYKCIDGPPSPWDREWHYHPPFPLLSVEWLDITDYQTVHDPHIPPTDRSIDHSEWLGRLLSRIGFDYVKGNRMIRIFGYSPKNFDLFES